MNRLVRLAAAWVLVSLATVASGAEEALLEAPDVVVDKAAAQVLKRMDGQRDYLREHPDELYTLVEEIFLPHFDRAYAAARVLGRHRREASAAQRRRFTDALYNYVLRSYGEGLLEFTSDRLEVLPFRGMPEDTKATIRTRVYMDDGKQVPVNYSLRRGKTGPWRVWDVTIEGISYVKNFQEQLDAEIRAKGLDAVIQRLEQDAAGTATAES
jgi:phospholipid transport system substrate-binding protein